MSVINQRKDTYYQGTLEYFYEESEDNSSNDLLKEWINEKIREAVDKNLPNPFEIIKEIDENDDLEGMEEFVDLVKGGLNDIKKLDENLGDNYGLAKYTNAYGETTFGLVPHNKKENPIPVGDIIDSVIEGVKIAKKLYKLDKKLKKNGSVLDHKDAIELMEMVDFSINIGVGWNPLLKSISKWLEAPVKAGEKILNTIIDSRMAEALCLPEELRKDFYEMYPGIFTEDIIAKIEDPIKLEKKIRELQSIKGYDESGSSKNTYVNKKPGIIIDGVFYRFNFSNFATEEDKIRYKKLVDEYAQSGFYPVKNNSISEFFEKLFHKNKDFYTTSKTAAEKKIDPLVLDLNGDGIKLVGEETGVYFDLDNSGKSQRTAWVNNEDGFLVLDRNKDGIISNGQELFGDETILKDGSKADSGFEALSEWDENNDGIIDENDAIFSKLNIWVDKNTDGISQEDELKTLSDHGIKSINLGAKATNQTVDGNNILTKQGSFEKINGTINHVNEYMFVNDTFDSKTTDLIINEDKYNDELLNRPDILELPNVKGFGNLHELRYAMLNNETLTNLVKEFVAEQDVSKRKIIIENILMEWSDSNKIQNPMIGGIETRKLDFLEKIFGDKFVGVNGSTPNGPASIILNSVYANTLNTLYYQLMSQSHLKEEMECILNIELSDGTTVLNFFNLRKKIMKNIDIDYLSGISNYKELNEIIKIFGWEKEEAYIEMQSNLGDEKSQLTEIDNFVIGSNSNDASINGDNQKNILLGGKGNDILHGSAGNDTYIFNKGDGQDTIDDYSSHWRDGKYYYNAGTDTLKFGEGITKEDLLAKLDGSNLIVGLKEDDKIFDELSDKVTLTNFKNANARIEYFEFTDGEKLDMNNLVLTDTSDDTISANDTNNIIITNEGNDIISGNLGNDLIYGGAGDDIYNYKLGDGNDTIIDESGSDKLVLDINPLDLIFNKNGNDLEIEIAGTDDEITIKNWNTDSIEEIYVDGDKYISNSNIDILIQEMSAFGASHEGISWEQAREEKKEELSTILSSYYE